MMFRDEFKNLNGLRLVAISTTSTDPNLNNGNLSLTYDTVGKIYYADCNTAGLSQVRVSQTSEYANKVGFLFMAYTIESKSWGFTIYTHIYDEQTNLWWGYNDIWVAGTKILIIPFIDM